MKTELKLHKKETKNALIRFLLLCVTSILALSLSILVMINGWGLEPKSWWWIIGVGYGGLIFIHIIVEICKVKK